MSSLAEKFPVNYHIRATFVYLIDQNGQAHSKVHINEAIAMAKNAGLDLVQVSADSAKPTCKIIDFGKFKYEASKQKAPVVHKTKELLITAHIGDHDLQAKITKLKEFIAKKYSVVFGIKFKNRKERANADKMKDILLECLKSSEVKVEGLVFQYAPDKITVLIR